MYQSTTPARASYGCMLHYERSMLISAPVETVFAFHERADALEILSPPGPPVRVLRREGGLQVGAEVELLVPLGPFHERWLARHTAYEKNRLFVDTQVSGPFRSWTHTHRFAPHGDGTLLTDSIDFVLPLAPLSEWLAGWAVRRQLDAMFRYRHEVTRRYCETLG